jgi:hypothetical protein
MALTALQMDVLSIGMCKSCQGSDANFHVEAEAEALSADSRFLGVLAGSSSLKSTPCLTPRSSIHRRLYLRHAWSCSPRQSLCRFVWYTTGACLSLPSSKKAVSKGHAHPHGVSDAGSKQAIPCREHNMSLGPCSGKIETWCTLVLAGNISAWCMYGSNRIARKLASPMRRTWAKPQTLMTTSTMCSGVGLGCHPLISHTAQAQD